MDNASLSTIKVQLDFDFENVGYIYEFFRGKSEKNAVDLCLNFLDANATNLTAEEISFADLPQPLVTKVLSRDTFFAKEVDILLALIRWHQNKNECDLHELFEHIRWCHISSMEYADRVMPLNVISNDQYFEYVQIEKPVRKSPFSSTNQRPESRNSVSMVSFENPFDSTDEHISSEGQSTSQWTRRSAAYNPSRDDWKYDSYSRKYWCDYCPSKFDRKHSVRRHIMSQHGPKQFNCDECGINYTEFYQLRDHYKAHEVNFTCIECGQNKFTLHSSIRSHIKDGRCAKRRAMLAAKALLLENK